MLTAIKGVFENGQILLKEIPKINKKMNVIVTFLEEEKRETNTKTKIRKAGGLGKTWIADDFNEPLEDLKEYM